MTGLCKVLGRLQSVRAAAVVLAVLVGQIATTASSYEQGVRIPDMPELRVVIGPDEALKTNGYVDGQLVMRIQLVSAHPFEALSLKPPVIPTAETIQVLRPRTRKVSTYAGQGYVFETAIAILPRESGVLAIPPVTAVGMVEPEKGREVNFNLASATVQVKIAAPTPDFSDPYSDPWELVAHRVEMDEDWSVPVEDIRVGEVIKRRIQLRAWGTTAERLPELEHPRTRGIRVSSPEVTLRTEKSPDGLLATAEYVWSLQAEPQQVAFIAPVGLPYWHPVEHRRRKAAVPGHRLEPLPADSAQIAARLMAEANAAQARDRAAGFAIAAVIAAPVVVFLLSLLRAWLPTRADLRLKSACAGAGPKAMYRSFCFWLTDSDLDQATLQEHGTTGRTLRDHLFAPGHPPVGPQQQLVAEALKVSRNARITKLFAQVRALWAYGTRST